MWIYGRNSIESFLDFNSKYVRRVLLIKQHRNIINKCRVKNITITMIDQNHKIYKKFSKKVNQGIFAEIRDIPIYSVKDLVNKALDKKENAKFLLFDQIQDSRNLGAIIRTASASGVIDGIMLTKKNSVSINADVVKCACGAMLDVPIAYISNIFNTIKYLKQRNIWVCAIDMNSKSNLYTHQYDIAMCFIIGGEDQGVRKLLIKHADLDIYIPMVNSSSVNCLNVSVSSSLLMYEIFRQTKETK